MFSNFQLIINVKDSPSLCPGVQVSDKSKQRRWHSQQMIHIKVETNKSSSDNMEMYLAKGRDTFQRFAAHISQAGRGREREYETEREAIWPG